MISKACGRRSEAFFLRKRNFSFASEISAREHSVRGSPLCHTRESGYPAGRDAAAQGLRLAGVASRNSVSVVASWMPAFAGMTREGKFSCSQSFENSRNEERFQPNWSRHGSSSPASSPLKNRGLQITARRHRRRSGWDRPPDDPTAATPHDANLLCVQALDIRGCPLFRPTAGLYDRTLFSTRILDTC